MLYLNEFFLPSYGLGKVVFDSVPSFYTVKKLFLAFSFSMCLNYLSAQESTLIDSLKTELYKLPIDTSRVSILNKIAAAYNKNNSDSLRYYAQKAYDLGSDLQFDRGVAYSLNTLSIYNQTIGDNELALNQLIESSDILQKMGKPEVGIAYYNIARLYRYLDEPSKAIKYLKMAKEHMPERMLGYIDMGIGLAQLDINDYKNALNYIDKALVSANTNNDNTLKGTCYQLKAVAQRKLEVFDSAEINYKKSIKLFENENNKSQLAASLDGLANVYLGQGEKVDKIQAKITESRMLAEEMKDLNALLSSYKTQVKLDSLNKDFTSAFKNQRKILSLKDSIFSIEKDKNLTLTETRFQSRKKEEQIKLLEKQKELQDIKDEQRKRTIWIVSIGLIFISMLSVYLAHIYLQKRQVNKKLLLQKEEITQQNLKINETLKEKELLIGEINHRAKNNLYIVERLLTAQLNEAELSETKTLLRESQKRIQSITLLHNQLISKDMPAAVNMRNYIDELLDNYVSTDKNIEIRSDLDEIIVDSSRAMVLGLIINELVTNSIKHSKTKRTEVKVELKENENSLKLIVKDKNRMDAIHKEKEKKTGTSFFGLELIKGLVKQLKGTIELISDSGVQVQITLPITREIV